MEISIIVPVYNAAGYLETCINSILAQTLTDFEVILVNDGSLDESGSILDRYAEKDSRISVIHQENSGPSVARNKGLDHAKGHYIAFIDSDDYIEPDFLEQLHGAMIDSDAELAVSGCFWEQNGRFERQENPAAEYSRSEYIVNVLNHKIFDITAFGPCCKLFKRSVLLEHGLRFDPGFKLSEDRIFNASVMALINKAVSLSYVGYHYVNNPRSLTHHSYERRTVKGIIEAEACFCQRMEFAIRQAALPKEYETYIKKMRLHTLLTMNGYILRSRRDGSGIRKKELYDAAFPVAVGSVLTDDRQGAVWRILDAAVSKRKIGLFRIWAWCSKMKQRIKNRTISCQSSASSYRSIG